MIAPPDYLAAPAAALPTIWGLTPREVHDVYWGARGVRVVRPGTDTRALAGSEVFLLLDSRSLVLFDLRHAIDHLHWTNPKLMCVRVRASARHATDVPGGAAAARKPAAPPATELHPWASTLVRIGFTANADVAVAWASGDLTWRRLRGEIAQTRRGVLSINGATCDGESPGAAAAMVGRIATMWDRPDLHIERAERVAPRVWKDAGTRLAGPPRCPGPVWLGTGRTSVPEQAMRGPAILWDGADPTPTDGTAAAAQHPDPLDALAEM